MEEAAARLRGISLPFGMMQQANAELDSAREQAAAVLGSSGTGMQAISGAVENAKASVDGAYSVIQEVENQLQEAAASHLQG